jgi:hypothetical protein
MTIRATMPRPAAATADRVSVLPRNVMAAHDIRRSQSRTTVATAPPSDSGSNRTSV